MSDFSAGTLEQHRLGIPLGKIATIADVVDGGSLSSDESVLSCTS